MIFLFTDQAKWKEIAKDCGGKSQSPIDIKGAKNAGKPGSLALSPAYKSKSLSGSFKNNGHSVQFTPNSADDFIATVDGKKYQFLQLHFHWGSKDTQGSEHRIEGKQFPMEMHMVHKSTSGDGKLMVMGLMFKMGSKSKGLKPLIKKMKQIRKADKETKVSLSLAPFIKATDMKSYYNYQGSLTTPGTRLTKMTPFSI